MDRQQGRAGAQSAGDRACPTNLYQRCDPMIGLDPTGEYFAKGLRSPSGESEWISDGATTVCSAESVASMRITLRVDSVPGHQRYTAQRECESRARAPF